MCVYVSVCACVFSVCTLVHMCICVCICLCIYKSVWAFVLVCTCMCVCVCARAHALVMCNLRIAVCILYENFITIQVNGVIPYIANCSRWKTFADGQGTSIRWKTFTVRSPWSKCAHVRRLCHRLFKGANDLFHLIERICLTIPNNYIYR